MKSVTLLVSAAMVCAAAARAEVPLTWSSTGHIMVPAVANGDVDDDRRLFGIAPFPIVVVEDSGVESAQAHRSSPSGAVFAWLIRQLAGNRGAHPSGPA
jgi:hypothetical protein